MYLYRRDLAHNDHELNDPGAPFQVPGIPCRAE
uniref:Uncharacterized protein n=1 Tax=Arundo donax TaxID=35708 RepID=A0A0A8YYC2_ARUDO